jgi:hypothetical protein
MSDCSWHVDPHLQFVRHMGEGHPQFYEVTATHLLQATTVAPIVSVWQPACVVDTPHPTDPDGTLRFLVGPWSSIQVDPSVWHLGADRLLTYAVRNGTARIIQWHCRSAPGWVVGSGVRPKLWGPGGGVEPALASTVADIASRQSAASRKPSLLPVAVAYHGLGSWLLT